MLPRHPRSSGTASQSFHLPLSRRRVKKQAFRTTPHSQTNVYNALSSPTCGKGESLGGRIKFGGDYLVYVSRYLFLCPCYRFHGIHFTAHQDCRDVHTVIQCTITCALLRSLLSGNTTTACENRDLQSTWWYDNQNHTSRDNEEDK